MNYALAKELRDKKFPESRNDIAILDEKSGITYYHPTLSELIEACGELFVLHSPKSLDVNEEWYQHPDYIWTAYSQRKETDCKAIGSTPEEAVARLWLAINNK